MSQGPMAQLTSQLPDTSRAYQLWYGKLSHDQKAESADEQSFRLTFTGHKRDINMLTSKLSISLSTSLTVD